MRLESSPGMAWLLLPALLSVWLILGLWLGVHRMGWPKEKKEVHWPEDGLGVMAHFNCQHDTL